MNAAFMLVTTACLAGADSAPPAAPAAPAPAATSACCGNACDSCCEEGCLKRLLNRFRHSSCGCDTCGGSQTTCAPAHQPACTTSCATSCDSCGEHGLRSLFSRFHSSSSDCCGASSSTTCGSGCGDCGCEDGLLKRLCNRFRHRGDCCDTGSTCDGCGTGVAPAPGPKAETIPAPRTKPADKMPEGKGGKEVHVIPPQPIAPPTLEVTPVTTPRVEIQN